jgi:hypothetical protein
MQLSNLYLRIFACLHVKDVIFHIFIKVNKSDIIVLGQGCYYVIILQTKEGALIFLKKEIKSNFH